MVVPDRLARRAFVQMPFTVVEPAVGIDRWTKIEQRSSRTGRGRTDAIDRSNDRNRTSKMTGEFARRIVRFSSR